MTELQLSTGPEGEIEIIDIELFTRNGWTPPHGKHYKVKIGARYFIFHQQWVTREEILEKAGFQHVVCHILYQLIRGCELERLEPGQRVNLAHPGIEHFLVADPDVFYYYIDGEEETTEHKELTPNQILAKAGITPLKDYYLVKINADGSQHSYKDHMAEPIKMVCPAAKYVSIFNGPTPVS